ncbi:MAG: hypothetical protein K8J31_29265 [Anaerolineae bacterium]|nr:hypothetical protein [Anaerolineae bacterium]
MAELLVSYVVKSHHGKPYGQRIFVDGQAEAYRVSKLVKGDDGSYKDEPVSPGWYPAVRLNADQVKTIEQAVAASGLRDLPSQVQGDTKRSTANREAQWEVMTADGIKTIAIVPWPPGGDTGQALFDLSRRLGEIVNEALSS